MKTNLSLLLALTTTFSLSACKVGDMTLTDRAPSATGPASSITFNGIDSITSVAGMSVQLNWTNATGAANYLVFNVTSGTPSVIATLSSGTSFYSVTGLSPNTTYKFRVRLTDTSGATDANTNDVSVTTPSVTATFNGWTHVRSVGPKSPASVSSDLGTSPASTTLVWNAVTLSSGSVSSYNIYRSTTPNTQTYATPLATGISASTRSYTDSTVTAKTTYYYTIAPVVSGQLAIPASVADREITVITPPDNMVLVHRWIANLDMCLSMGKTWPTDFDRTNYSCASTAPGGTGTRMDYEHSLFVDAVEQGCNFSSASGKCGSANGCIGGSYTTPSGNVTGTVNDVYYNRQNGQCYINTNGSTGWIAANSASNAQLALMASNQPGLPPLIAINQTQSQLACNQQSISSFTGVKRLLHHKEFIEVAAWDSSLSDAAIVNLENNSTSHGCNTNSASGQTYDDNDFPGSLETITACLHGDCSSTAASICSVRTGSTATNACVSRYGAQDLVGNVWEWNSDQTNCTGSTCLGVNAASNTDDNMNGDWDGVAFDDTNGPAPATGSATVFSNWGKILFPIGLPALSSYSGDGAVALSSSQAHGDGFWINSTSSPRGAITGGAWYADSGAGRLALNLTAAPTHTSTNVGFRCSLPAD